MLHRILIKYLQALPAILEYFQPSVLRPKKMEKEPDQTCSGSVFDTTSDSDIKLEGKQCSLDDRLGLSDDM